MANKAKLRSEVGLIRKGWRDNKYMWVIGCIDANGAITANPSKEGRNHTIEESRGKRFRWSVWSQEYLYSFEDRQFTTEEAFAVWDWLIKRGYTDDQSMPDTELNGDAR